ncbi:hypothetical protein GWI33_021430 [Rhynchophorus ferrugineus]|uniref:Uncharacterized protein n=1 Tax=Rhynchophorus ferrugineus TaxID=354439 RepID=A0A834HP37_RHYFE|nr:hypothetical protein GWI33_021430 [Rhynchophorus ferrugineus]
MKYLFTQTRISSSSIDLLAQSRIEDEEGIRTAVPPSESDPTEDKSKMGPMKMQIKPLTMRKKTASMKRKNRTTNLVVRAEFLKSRGGRSTACPWVSFNIHEKGPIIQEKITISCTLFKKRTVSVEIK